jgi:ABC transporter substrate binding protein
LDDGTEPPNRLSLGGCRPCSYANVRKELVGLQPDLILASTTPVVAAVAQETDTIPIVFVVVSDPIGSRFVESLPRPGKNITGFINIESSLGGKWLELLKEIAPRISRVSVLFNPDTAPHAEYYVRRAYSEARAGTGRTLKTSARLNAQQNLAFFCPPHLNRISDFGWRVTI